MLGLWMYRSSNVGELTAVGEASETFSSARYEPMVHLLDEEDFLFLAKQPGYRPEVGKKLRRERRRIFRLYLRDLAAEFHRMHAQARQVAASLPAEHSRIIGVLLRQQVTFWRAMTAIELSLTLDQLGIGKVNARGLVTAIANMQAEIGSFAPAAA